MEFGFLSILPPLLTIVLAIITKNVFISLFIGVFLGFCVIDGFHIISALNATLNGFITTFESHSNTIVIASYNIVTVEGAAASRVFFHLKAEAVRMGE